ncbi:M28 family peptidase [Nonomuraea sp. NEAU-A123]|uniref:M28 family peptidase n=1 Tax=Nonomuraea sp. NEAU-A123 TaxID=2839649 RepID=UPI001BE41668|nr:M28 family peptidase [Nonomuraea sp. NEAU-A123]MBT2229162.1 M28 family peptidase [Nonomuraea sp. NEAU-A123]
MMGKLIDVPRRTLAGLLALLTLAGLIMLTAMGHSTMQPIPAAAPGREFSAERALRHLERFAAEPRPLGSPASDRARTYLVGQLRAAGLDVKVQRAIGANSAAGLASFGQVDNVVATGQGTDATGTLLIAAHYDSAAVGPGASDDGAAVAAMLETVRALGTAPLRNDLVLLMTDGEEDGVLGAEAFVREHPLGRKGGVLLNWEARGVSGPSLMFETSRNNAGLVSTFAAAAPHPRGDSVMGELYRLLPNNTDFTPLAKAGFTGMNFAYIERSSRYHTADDSIANLDHGSLQHHGSTMLALARTLGDADLPALAADHDVTYFRILGVMVTYPDWLVWPLAVLAVLAVAGLALLARRARLASIPRIIVAAASAATPLVLAVILAQGLWEVLVALRPAYDGMGGLLHRPLAYQAAVTLLAVLALLAWYLPLRGRLGPAALAIGALVWPAGLGVLAAWFAPGAAFVLTFPALLCALGGLAALLLRGAVWRVVALTFGASMAAMLLPALAGTAFDGMGLALGGVSALVLALFGLTLLPLAELTLPEPSRSSGGGRDGGGGRGSSRGSGLGVVVVAVLAVVQTGVGLATDVFDATNPQRSHLAYVLNADTWVAHWVSGDAEPTAWTKRYVSGRDTGSLPAGYARRTLWTGGAPVIETDGPRVAVLSRVGDTVRLRVRAGQGARSVTLRVERPITQVTAAATGLTPVTVPVSGVRANTWPGEIRFRGIPARGVDITLRVPGTDPVRLTAIAETDGLSAVPGFTPRPPGLVASTREDGDLIAVTRTYALRPA